MYVCIYMSSEGLSKTWIITRSPYFQRRQRLFRREGGPCATERLEQRQKHCRTPIQSSRFLPYRFHRPLEISSVKRNAQDSRGGEDERLGQGITAVTRARGGRREREENKTPGFYKRFWNCVRLPEHGRDPGTAGQNEGGSAGQWRNQ